MLRRVGIDAEVQVSRVDEPRALAAVEAVSGPLEPADVALALARAKADDIAFSASAARDALVLGCDSVLELDGEVHGKPGSAEVAVQRWRRMRGRSGALHTGHWLVDTRAPEAGGTRGSVGATSSTVVHFAELTDAEIDSYVATGEPLHVAGAFTIDGLGGAFVSGVEGDHHGVVGLSLPLLRLLLADLGVAWFDLARPTI